MAPKKQQKGQKKDGKGKSGGDSKPGPQVRLSAQNEQKLRRLLQNNAAASRASIPSSSSSSTAVNEIAMSEAQRTKRLLNIYDKLSCEGFTSEQIERALSALPGSEGMALETALDWLCLNIPGNELPLKFSSGVSVVEHEGAEKSVNVISAARTDWVPSIAQSEEFREEPVSEIALKPKLNIKEEKKELLQAEGADWIRRYMSQQAEEESEHGTSDGEASNDSDWEMWIESSERTRRKDIRTVVDPATRAVSAVAEFQAARQAAMEAKEEGDKEKQAMAGRLIRELKQEMISLGVSEDILSTTIQPMRPTKLDKTQVGDASFSEEENVPAVRRGEKIADTFSVANCLDLKTEVRRIMLNSGTTDKATASVDGTIAENNLVKPDGEILVSCQADPVIASIASGGGEEEQEAEEMLGLFNEDVMPDENLPGSIMEMQKKEKAFAWALGQASERKQDGGKKGGKSSYQEDMTKQPKAILQQQCQKSGWGAPKYEKISGRGNSFSYSLSIIRPTTGRGKNKKVGGLLNFQFPDPDYVFESADDAQNGVATLALFQLFPELPLYQIVTEPYRSLCLKWRADAGEETTKQEDSEDARRAVFVKSLVNADASHSKSKDGRGEEFDHEKVTVKSNETNLAFGSNTLREERPGSDKKAESYSLKQEFGEKMKMKKYKMMLEAREALPMAESKMHLLELLRENDVVVVSGETGCGKTTQVPQYILDDMILSGQGGFCNIICTQPRRIAAISVAERVADERCEPPPGSYGSLVGYQVRLDKAWNPRTRLLFCTTGILLRKLAGDSDLKDISHIIVDEVHERSVLGDFLLIILKDILERRSITKSSKLKLIVMSATVDASLFSHYFGDCPIITAKGRTHPVTSFFLEDVYDNLEYRLASDSPAALTNSTIPKKKRGGTAARDFCKSYFLSSPTLYMIRDMRIQFGSLLADIGFIELPRVDNKRKDEIDKWLDDLSHPFNIYSQHSPIIKSILCAGLYPNVASICDNNIKAGHANGPSRHVGLSPSNRPCWFDGRREVFIHPTSINSRTSEFRHPFMVFLDKVETSKVYLRDTTIISPYALLFFGGSISIQHQTGSVTVDSCLKMNTPAQTAVLFKELRLALRSILQELLQKPKERATVAEREVIHSITQVLVDEEKPQL